MSRQKSDGFVVKQVMVHEEPHPDELWAIFLLKTYGEERYPGISTATITFSKTGNKTPDGRTAEEWEKDGVLMVGTGGGRFDEHATMDGKPRKKSECALTMVCRDLEIFDDPALRRVIPYVRDEDTQGGSGDVFTLTNILKALYEDPDNKPEEVVTIGLKAIKAFYRREVEFAEAEAIVSKQGMIHVTGAEFPIKIIAVESDNRAIGKACRRRRAHLVIQQQQRGNVQIYTNKRLADLDLRDLVRLLRLEEDFVRDRAGTTDWKLLEIEGKNAQVGEEWFFHKEGGWILNGSLSAPGIPPTKVPLQRIVELAVMAFSKGFEETCPNNRSLNPCRGRRNCPWHQAGLMRCRMIRFQTGKAPAQTV